MSRRRLPLLFVLAVALVACRQHPGRPAPAAASAGERRRARDLPAARRVHVRAVDRPAGRRRIDLDRFVVRRRRVSRRSRGAGEWSRRGGQRVADSQRARSANSALLRHAGDTVDLHAIAQGHEQILADRDTRDSRRQQRRGDVGRVPVLSSRRGGAAALLPRRILLLGTRGRGVHAVGVRACVRAHDRDCAARRFGLRLAHRRHASAQLAPTHRHDRQLIVLRGPEHGRAFAGSLPAGAHWAVRAVPSLWRIVGSPILSGLGVTPPRPECVPMRAFPRIAVAVASLALVASPVLGSVHLDRPARLRRLPDSAASPTPRWLPRSALVAGATSGFGYGLDVGLGFGPIGIYGGFDHVKFGCRLAACQSDGRYTLQGVTVGLKALGAHVLERAPVREGRRHVQRSRRELRQLDVRPSECSATRAVHAPRPGARLRDWRWSLDVGAARHREPAHRRFATSDRTSR